MRGEERVDTSFKDDDYEERGWCTIEGKKLQGNSLRLGVGALCQW